MTDMDGRSIARAEQVAKQADVARELAVSDKGSKAEPKSRNLQCNKDEEADEAGAALRRGRISEREEQAKHAPGTYEDGEDDLWF